MQRQMLSDLISSEPLHMAHTPFTVQPWEYRINPRAPSEQRCVCVACAPQVNAGVEGPWRHRHSWKAGEQSVMDERAFLSCTGVQEVHLGSRVVLHTNHQGDRGLFFFFNSALLSLPENAETLFQSHQTVSMTHNKLNFSTEVKKENLLHCNSISAHQLTDEITAKDSRLEWAISYVFNPNIAATDAFQPRDCGGDVGAPVANNSRVKSRGEANIQLSKAIHANYQLQQQYSWPWLLTSSWNNTSWIYLAAGIKTDRYHITWELCGSLHSCRIWSYPSIHASSENVWLEGQIVDHKLRLNWFPREYVRDFPCQMSRPHHLATRWLFLLQSNLRSHLFEPSNSLTLCRSTEKSAKDTPKTHY